ncbi:FAD-dependent oxidoreductase, partial [Acinetobacter higginsii]|uniref:FAD-dependent oxidoreductase n=1 Tax=Acinetobacter higginsii TaxID=70347 RepID=UPI00300ABA58
MNNGVFANIYIDAPSCSFLVKNRNNDKVFALASGTIFTSANTVNVLIGTEQNRAISAENNLQSQINAIAGGSGGGYKTYAEMIADSANIPANSIVTVTNDPDPTKNGDYQFNGTVFTKSAYDPLTQAKEFTQQFIFMSDVVINNIPYLYVIADKNGRVSTGLTMANLEMKNIGGSMKEINSNYQEVVGSSKNAVLDSSSRVVEQTCEEGKKHIQTNTQSGDISQALTKADLSTFDVVIYGSGASAMTAARTAKDNGLSVCLICPDYRVGGMMSSGVSVFDGPTQGKAAEVGGINKAFQGHTRRLVLEISTYYGSSLLPTSTTFEPRVAQKVCNDWCNRYVDLLILDQQIHDSFTGVVTDNGQIKGIWTKRGFIKGNCFIDSSYTGDLLRFAGVSWTDDVEAASTAEPQAGAQVG